MNEIRIKQDIIDKKIFELTHNKLWLAPLAGFTDSAFRTICKQNGADVVVTEMVSADGLVYNEDQSIKYALFEDHQRPVGIQLFGNDPEMMAKGCEIIIKLKPDFIDINMGCPVKKVVKRGAGSALMKTPEIAFEIVRNMKSVLKDTDIILTTKIRAGWDMKSVNAVEYSIGLEEAGSEIIIVHPRTQTQMFSGKSDWNIIKKVKEAVNVPVVGNGDIFYPEDAIEMKSLTNCDSLMIGRGTYGNPWIFDSIKNFERSVNNKVISPQKKLKTILKHFELARLNKGEDVAVREMRAHLGYYTKGLRGGAEVRDKVNKSKNYNLIIEILSQFFGELL